jgi:uncharacterized membrane protein YcaP (DUF421 family)
MKMTDQVTLKIPRVSIGSVSEFVIDAIVVIAVGNIAGKLFLETNTPLTEQLTSFVIVLGCVGLAAKYVMSTRIFKAKG